MVWLKIPALVTAIMDWDGATKTDGNTSGVCWDSSIQQSWTYLWFAETLTADIISWWVGRHQQGWSWSDEADLERGEGHTDRQKEIHCFTVSCCPLSKCWNMYAWGSFYVCLTPQQAAAYHTRQWRKRTGAVPVIHLQRCCGAKTSWSLTFTKQRCNVPACDLLLDQQWMKGEKIE